MTKEQEIQKLAKRRSELGAEIRDMQVRKAELTEQLGRAIIDRVDSGKVEADLFKINSKLQGMESALAQADGELNKLTAELKAERAEAARVEVAALFKQLSAEYDEAKTYILSLQKKADQWRNDISAGHAKLELNGLKGCHEYLKGEDLYYSFPFVFLDSLIQQMEFREPEKVRKLREAPNK